MKKNLNEAASIESEVGGSMSKAEYKAAGKDISDRYKSDKCACKTMSGNARQVCIDEAKGRENVAEAELRANYSPSSRHRRDLGTARADAAYALAKGKCDGLSGDAEDACRKEAKDTYHAAKAEAKAAEKTADVRASTTEKRTYRRRDAAAAKLDVAVGE